MNFGQLTPLEFEELTAHIFRSRGFRTFLTPASGDGGIDIEAVYDGEVFKGTYLIQCKLWKNNVGEPQVRDLYGVVQDRQALKGILVTSSGFSPKAVRFAENKNIDLINGQTFIKLLKNINEHGKEINNYPIFSNQIKGFLEEDSFDAQMYHLLVDEIETNPTFEQPYMQLLELLLKSVLSIGKKSKYNGIINEISFYSNRYRDRFTKGRSNSEIGKRVGIDYIILLIHLLNGELTNVYSQINFIREAKFKGNITDQAYRASIPTRYKPHITDIVRGLQQFISNQDINYYYIPFTTSFYYDDSNPYIRVVRPHTENISMSWIIDEFGINELEDIEQQKQLLAIYMEKE
ncbi:restriction endonuclease [Bacilli bacterium]|nr:hypothetical protein WH51_15810 [Bacilli bacterium VT-13-104]PZD81373.1 restriction endonuclease [Bacilli bacterium]PZD83142.1 restriction endonuclease [Bacilli bacterium]PZD84563.1 restriction endonuclease [Bacilli bacterium]RCO04375.1 restriction endonuclease [Bacilli bacterium]